MRKKNSQELSMKKFKGALCKDLSPKNKIQNIESDKITNVIMYVCCIAEMLAEVSMLASSKHPVLAV